MQRAQLWQNKLQQQTRQGCKRRQAESATRALTDAQKRFSDHEQVLRQNARPFNTNGGRAGGKGSGKPQKEQETQGMSAKQKRTAAYLEKLKEQKQKTGKWVERGNGNW